MSEINELMQKYGLDGLSIHYPTLQAWHPDVGKKGYVTLVPPDTGVFYGNTVEEAVAKVAAHQQS